MKRSIALCAMSALLGAVVAVWIAPSDPVSPSIAQESLRQPVDATSPYAPTQPQTSAPPLPALPAAQLTGNGPLGLAAPQAAPGWDDLTPEERVNIAVYDSANRSVVNITTEGVRPDRFFFFEIPSQGEGSGSIITREGHILTNHHVVEGARQIQVNLFDGKTYDARMVGADPFSDVAVLKIDAPSESLYPVTFGESSNLRVGQKVFAIGNPFGFERTLSTGIISSLNRTMPGRSRIRTIKQIIQIDAAINPGNSGGPLLDSHGRMIGMNWAIASKTGESAGVGFAIPVNTIARVVPQLISKGRVIRADMGVAKVYQTDRGLLVAQLLPNGPAEKAGLRGPRVTQRGPLVYVDRSAADLIIAVDNQPVKTADDFLTIVESKEPGQQVLLTVVREGRKFNFTVTLGASE